MIRGALRTAVIAVVALALWDPAVVRDETRRTVMGMALLDAPTLRLAREDGRSGQDHADDAASVLAASLAGHADVVRLPAPFDPADACAGLDGCILVGEGSAAPGSAPAVPTWSVLVPPPAVPHVVRSQVLAAPHEAAGGLARIEVAAGTAERDLTVVIRDGPLELGRATGRARDGAVVLDVPFVFAGPAPRALRVDVEGAPAIGAGLLRVAPVVDRLPVLVYEPRPSWGASFVRRALEDDARFEVRVLSRVGPARAVRTGVSSLGPAVLGDLALVVVGAPAALSPADTSHLLEFARAGGSLLVLPDDASPTALAGPLRELLLAAPVAVGPLRASELLLPRVEPGDEVVAGLPSGEAVVVVRPLGRGRLLLSGAADAWRWRDLDAEASARFWRAAAAGLAERGRPVRLVSEAGRAASPRRLRWRLTTRGVHRQETSPPIEGRLDCGAGGEQPLWFWPAGEGSYEAEAAVPLPDAQCTAIARVGTAAAVRAALVGGGDRSVAMAGPDSLAAVARLAGGASVPAAQVGDLAARVLGALPPRSEQAEWHPMRSPWWTMVLVALLGSEWWLRRRAGLR